MSDHQHPTDRNGHILNNVDIHLVVTSGQATVNIYGIWVTYEDGLPMEHTGRLLSGTTLPAPGAPDMDDWRSLRHLDEAFEEWNIPSKYETAVRWLGEWQLSTLVESENTK